MNRGRVYTPDTSPGRIRRLAEKHVHRYKAHLADHRARIAAGHKHSGFNEQELIALITIWERVLRGTCIYAELWEIDRDEVDDAILDEDDAAGLLR